MHGNGHEVNDKKPIHVELFAPHGWVWIREGSGNKGGGKRTPHYAMAEERESVLWS